MLKFIFHYSFEIEYSDFKGQNTQFEIWSAKSGTLHTEKEKQREKMKLKKSNENQN